MPAPTSASARTSCRTTIRARAGESSEECTSRSARGRQSSSGSRAARWWTSWSTSAGARPTFGEWEAFTLNDENLHQIYAPIGFAHGFCVTSDGADVVYKCINYYDASIERGIAYNDPDVGIEWPDLELIPSERDANAPLLRDVESELPFAYEG